MLRPALLAILVVCLVSPCPAASVGELAGHDTTHTVARGENLFTIARSYGLALDHLAFANGLAVGFAAPLGKTLVIPLRRVLPVDPPRDGLVLNLPERGIFFFRHGSFQDFYPAAIGRPGRFQTPRGDFRIVSRVVNPAWLPPAWAGLGKVVIPAGPKNPLGDRWMGLSARGVGIHATNSPSSVGGAVSHGCIRMYPEQARLLFDSVQVGMPVHIVYNPVKLGFDPATGDICLAVFPDVYGLVDLAGRARKLVEDSGLSPLVSPHRLASIVSRASGRAVALDDTEVTVVADGQPLHSHPSAILARERLWLPASTVRELGMQLQLTADQATVSYQGKEAVFPVWRPSDDADQEVAVLFEGRAFLPARGLLSSLGVPFRWQAATRTLSLRG